MKALTLTQPWASLVARGEKRIETRSWQTRYRGPLAIHAAKGWTRGDRDIALSEPFLSALGGQSGGDLLGVPIDASVTIPLGAFVAVCNLSAVIPTSMMDMRHPPSHAASHEGVFGDYGPGRFAWVLEDVTPLEELLPARGSLGLWTPEPDLAAVLEAYAPPWVPLEDRP